MGDKETGIHRNYQAIKLGMSGGKTTKEAVLNKVDDKQLPCQGVTFTFVYL